MDFQGAFFSTSDYEFIDHLLGEGAFGKVYLARDVNDDEPYYACKIINTNENFDAEQQRLLLCESMILHKLNHPSILKFKGFNFQ